MPKDRYQEKTFVAQNPVFALILTEHSYCTAGEKAEAGTGFPRKAGRRGGGRCCKIFLRVLTLALGGFHTCCPMNRASKPGRVPSVESLQVAVAPTGCPIAVEQFPGSHRAARHSVSSREQLCSQRLPPSLETQQHINQQRGPDLPLHGVGVAPEEVGQLQGPLDLLEEDLDLPAAVIRVDYRATATLQVFIGKANTRSSPSSLPGAMTRRSRPE